MASIEKQFRVGMSIRAPVSYWQEKQVRHEKDVPGWGKAAVWTFRVGVLLLLAVIGLSDPAKTVKAMADEAHFTSEQASAAYTTAWLTMGARIAVLTLLFVGPVRTFVRNYMSSQHLAPMPQNVSSLWSPIALCAATRNFKQMKQFDSKLL